MTDDEIAQERRRRGYWLRRARLRAELNQNEVARRLGMSERSGTTILAWEKGLRDPKAAQLSQLARIYGVPVSVLISPRATDEEWLDEIVQLAADAERQDWEEGQGRAPAAGGGPGAEPRKRSA